MWFLFLSVIVILAINIKVCWGEDAFDKAMFSVMVWMIGGTIAFFAGYPILRLTTGFYADYSTGEREGYITKLSEKGIVFKTNESQLQVGTGNMAALQEPWAFSVPDSQLPAIQENLGKKVRIKYTQFLLMPWRYGETDYLVTAVTPIE